MPWTISDVDRFNSGLTQSQKRRWVRIANSVLQRCLNNGGSQDECEASAIRQANGTVNNNLQDMNKILYIQTNNRYSLRRVEHQGRQHLVVPVVMMVEGVHCGSHGAIFHPAEELGRFTASWDGIPVTIDHPSDDNGQGISANSPQVIDRDVVGRVYNTYMDGDKLKGEVWLDEQRLIAVAPNAYHAIDQEEPVEVSVGVFSDQQNEQGEYEGEQYVAIARNHRPDHLALLPDAQGACSWEDGCGIRLNQKKGGQMTKKKKEQNDVGNLQSLKDNAVLQGYAVSPLENRTGYTELAGIIQRRLDNMDNGEKTHWLQELYENEFIYRVDQRDNNAMYFRQPYSVPEEGTVSFEGEPTRVQRKVEYVEVTQNNQNHESKNEESMKKKQVNNNQCCEEKVDRLIANEQTIFTDKHKEWLLQQNEETIDLFFPKEETQAPPHTNEEQIAKALKNYAQTPDKFIELAPEEVQDQLKSGLNLHRKQRQDMVKKIVNNAGDNGFTEEELKVMSTDQLRKMVNMIPEQGNYVGNGSGPAPVDNSARTPMMPGGMEPQNNEQTKKE